MITRRRKGMSTVEHKATTVKPHRRNGNREGSQKTPHPPTKTCDSHLQNREQNQQTHPEEGRDGRTAEENRSPEEEGAKQPKTL